MGKFKSSLVFRLAWVLLTAFSQIPMENQKQMAELNDLNTHYCPQKESTCKVGAKESLTAEKINI